MSKLTKCPYCGKESNLYSKEFAKYDQYYTYEGVPDGYSDLKHTDKRVTTPLYCSECDRRITTLEKLEGD